MFCRLEEVATKGGTLSCFYLHESVAVVDKWSAGDLLERLADIWQRLCLLDQLLVVVDQRQSYTEQDFGALVE